MSARVSRAFTVGEPPRAPSLAIREFLLDPSRRRRFGVWLLILLVGAALLYARYDWSVHGGFFARRGFVLSLYLLIIMLPTVYYLLLRTLHTRRVAIGVSVATFVVFTVPYKLLGLDSIYYYRTRPQWFVPHGSLTFFAPQAQGVHLPAPSLQFFPGGTLRAFPFDWLFMPLLFGLGTALVWFVWWVRGRVGFRIGRRLPVLLTAAFAVICMQAFLHSSMRAPYTYLSVFRAVQSAHRWYVADRFSDGSGATEGDQYAYSAIEDYFQGAPHAGDNAIIRRPLSFYIASQVSYFVNDFYAWLALNCLFWLAAVFATARLVMRLATPRAGLFAGALTAFGSGFIAFVATSAMYLQNYASAAIALCAFEDLVAQPPEGRRRHYVLFMGVLALCALIYDIEPLYVVLFAYGLARRVPWRPLLASLLGALVLYEGFTLAVTHILGISIVAANSEVVGQSLRAVLHILFHPRLSVWYDTFVTVVTVFAQEWLHAYFVVPAILALFGWRFLRDRPQKILVGVMFLMTFLIVGVFYIGQTTIAEAPREIYPYFVGVYLPAAVALDRLGTWLGGSRIPRSMAGVTGGNLRAMRATLEAAPWAIIALMAFLTNIDIFGYPTMYVEYFYNAAPAFLPH